MHPIINEIKNQNFNTFYNAQIQERKEFLYPPYSRLIKITLKHKEINTANSAANDLVVQLKNKFGNWIKGPVKPIFQKINNLYIREILIKIPRAHFAQLHTIKNELNHHIQSLNQYQKYKNCIVIKDVDVL
jgi:primosomal protein N' (replication factor Y)